MNFINNWIARLESSLSASGETLPLPAAMLARLALEPGTSYVLTICQAMDLHTDETEIVRIIGAPEGHLLERGLEGTAPAAWPAGAYVYCAVTAAWLQEVDTLRGTQPQLGDCITTVRDPGPAYLPADGRTINPSEYPSLAALLPATWVTAEAPWGEGDANSLAAVGDTWIVNGSNQWLRTADAGATWQEINANFLNVYEITAGPAGVWLATGARWMRSADNGATWTEVTERPSGTQGNAGDSSGKWISIDQWQGSWFSTDGGMTWAEMALDTPSPSAVATDGQGVWVITQNFHPSLRSTDHGVTWDEVPLMGADVAVSSGTWIIAGEGGMWRSVDDAATWAQVPDAPSGYEVQVQGADGLWLANINGVATVSEDDGLTWRAIDEVNLYNPRIAVPEAGRMLMAGRGALYRYGAGILPNIAAASPARSYIRAAD